MKRKHCKACQRRLPTDQFYPNRKSADGLQYTCKKCDLIRRARHTKACRAAGVMNYSQRSQQRLKIEILTKYSRGEPRCDCCGETHIEFLAVDHINGHGHQHRKQLATQGTGFYCWLKRERFPAGFRVLCHNCNHSHGQYGYCPHKTPRPICPPPSAKMKQQETQSRIAAALAKLLPTVPFPSISKVASVSGVSPGTVGHYRRAWGRSGQWPVARK